MLCAGGLAKLFNIVHTDFCATSQAVEVLLSVGILLILFFIIFNSVLFLHVNIGPSSLVESYALENEG